MLQKAATATSPAAPSPQLSPKIANILKHLQTALEIEYATVPIYLYAYYSIHRTPPASAFPDGTKPERIAELQTFANEAGGVIMSVAVEEMLHMSLAANLIRSLGGVPDLNLYRKKSTVYPTPLPHHNPDFNPDPNAPPGELKIPLARFSDSQLGYFLAIEYPETANAKPQGNNWDTIGQFYDYIQERIDKDTTDADFGHVEWQLAPHKGYYSPNNVDTAYPNKASWQEQPIDWNDPSKRGAEAAVYPNARSSGGLIAVHDKKSADHAIRIIRRQGEGARLEKSHEYDDTPVDKEQTHWYKFKTLQDFLRENKVTPEELAAFVYPLPDNPTLAGTYGTSLQYDYRPLVQLANAVTTYLFQMTQASYELTGVAQQMMFNIGMHKGMIFVLDKVINAMRYYHLDGDGTAGNGSGAVVGPTFENYHFQDLATAKQELLALWQSTPLDFQQGNPNILQRIGDLPDLNIGPGQRIHF